jgi:hypothetical protein
MSVTLRRLSLAISLTNSVLLTACASGGGSSSQPPPPQRGRATRAPSPANTAPVGQTWMASTHEHVDLWLHGYALLTADTATVPLFQRGYRERMNTLKAQRSIYTQLDANRERLSARFVANPALVNGQFAALYFSSFQEMQQVVGQFVQAQGDGRTTNDPTLRGFYSVLNASFPAPADRDWLRLFVQSLQDESRRFYTDYWAAEQRARRGVVQAFDSLWERTYRAKLQRYLNNTQQANGDLILSLPLGGEGRTVTVTNRANAVAVGFPSTPAAAIEVAYVFAHEVTSAVINTAITDNTTPAQQRSGLAAQYTATGAVRGGELLLERTAPELAHGYMRYYLSVSGAVVPAGDPSGAFLARFPLPDPIRDAITKQLDVVLGGI